MMVIRFFRVFPSIISLLLLLISNACEQSGTPISVSPSVIVPTPPQITPFTISLSPSVPPISPAPTEQPDFTYAPDEGQPVYPLSTLRILSPGNGSSLSSPIQTDLSVILGAGNTIQIELLNENGELLVKKLIRYLNATVDQRILIHPALDFEIENEEEAGRLALKTYDSFNRLISMSSCELTLLSGGVSEVKAAGVPYEPFLITEPASGAIINGGVVTVSGYARLVSRSYLLFELVDENGVGLANRQLMVKGEPGGSPVIFTTTLPYQVLKATPVRLIVRQSLGPLPGPAVANSLLLTIE